MNDRGFIDLKIIYLTGSYPPLEKGWQRKIRFAPNKTPFSAPYFSTAW